MKRKIKVWGKLRLYETSAVGIPAYPDAHASISSFSLIKALTSSKFRGKTDFVGETEDMGEQLNLEEEKETMEEQSQEKSIQVETETEIEETKKVDLLEIVKAIKEALKDGLEELETERGFVEKQTPKVKSLGELAIEQGLFVIK